jgi:hypothetical protein
VIRARALLVAAILAASGCQRHDTSATTGRSQAPAPPDTARIDLGNGTTPQDAVALVRAYYQAINRNRFPEAYEMWEGKGAATGKSLIAFLNGYAQTDRIDVTPGPPGAVVASGTTEMIAVPVEVTSTRSHATARYGGTITLRRSKQRNAAANLARWHIYKADLKPAA